MDTISQRLKALRETQNITSKELCSKLGFNTSTYSKLENGKKSIDVEELRKLTGFYNISADYLLGIDKPQIDIVMYMQRDKNLGQADIDEMQNIMEMMDEATTLRNTVSRI